MQLVRFRYSGRFGHFLRAEANCNGLTYPVSPRTALLGLLGAILGLEKDSAQLALADARLALAGRLPPRFWHKTNIRKDPPAPLPWEVKKSMKGTQADEKNSRFPQEYLWKPDFEIWAGLPENYHAELAIRLRERRWHFMPCLGLSELLADLEYLEEVTADPLPEGLYEIRNVFRKDEGAIDTTAACERGVTLHILRMPRLVTSDRVFTLADYRLEHEGRPVPIHTAAAMKAGNEVITFL